MARCPLNAPRCRSVALGVALLAAACDTRAPTHDAPVVRLLGDARVAVQTPWRADPAEPEAGLAPTFVRNFEHDAELDFTVTPILRQPGKGLPIVAREAAAAQRGQGGLRFADRDGAVFWWLPALPGAPYLARVQARVVGGHDGGVARAGELAVVEFTRAVTGKPTTGVTFAELQTLVGRPLAEQRAAAPVDGTVGEARLRFTTHALTNSVLVILFAGVPAAAPAASPSSATAPADPSVATRPPTAVDFDELALFELPLARVLPPLAEAQRRSGSNYEREVTIGGETRLAWIAPPPSEVRMPLTLPQGPFELRFAYGVAEETRRSAGRVAVEFDARLETAAGTTPIELPCRSVSPRTDVATAGWHDVRHSGNGSGERATLVLAARSSSGRPTEDLVAFGLPLLTPTRRPTGAPPNVILISIDTLRPDRLGTYGCQRPDGIEQSPILDRFAREAVVFEEARALAPYTLPSHATLLTGMHPAVHGVERYDSTLAAGSCTRLIDRFREAGYVSAAFTGGGFLSPLYGLWRGFDRWSTLDPFFDAGEPLRQVVPHPGEPALNAALWAKSGTAALQRWLADHAAMPFFLFLHTYAVHNYRPPPDLAQLYKVARTPGRFDPLGDSDERTPTTDELPDLRRRYDASIAAVDRTLAPLFATLREGGLLEQTIVVVLSDHGEEFGEHGGFGHGRTLYDEVLRVPLLMRVPGLGARRETAPVTLADVAPTLLSLCGLQELPGGCGRVLLPALIETPLPYSAQLDEIHLGQLRALDVGGQKLIEMTRFSPIRPRLPSFALHDRTRDAHEEMNLVQWDEQGRLLPDERQRPEFIRLRTQLDRHFEELRRLRLPDSALPGGLRSLDLDALGY